MISITGFGPYIDADSSGHSIGVAEACLSIWNGRKKRAWLIYKLYALAFQPVELGIYRTDDRIVKKHDEIIQLIRNDALTDFDTLRCHLLVVAKSFLYSSSCFGTKG